MKRPSIQNKLKEIAKKYNISLATANEIIKSQWDMVRLTCENAVPEEGFYPHIRVIGVGKFFVTPRRQNRIKLKLEADDLSRSEVPLSPNNMHGDAGSNTLTTTEEED